MCACNAREYPDRVIPLDQVVAITSLSRKTIQRWSRDGRFVKPLKLGTCLRWRLSSVLAWLAAQEQ
jgi:predicted DNA-binding transcriptional regulator AlpA